MSGNGARRVLRDTLRLRHWTATELDAAVRLAGGLRVAGARWPLEWGLWVQAQLCEARGDIGQALSLLKEAWDLAAPLRFCLSHRFVGPDLVRLAVAAGEREAAQAVTQDIADGARRARVASAAGLALRCQGLLADDPDVLLAAVRSYRKAPSTVELALTCEDAGAALARAGRGAAAVPVLDEALDFYLRCGMQRGAARVHAALRALGVRRRRPGRLRRPPVGWDSLTASELGVARMAAEGLTNPQIGDRLFISRRTVATHLASVFRKLGITNRVQLAAEASRRATRTRRGSGA